MGVDSQSSKAVSAGPDMAAAGAESERCTRRVCAAQHCSGDQDRNI